MIYYFSVEGGGETKTVKNALIEHGIATPQDYLKVAASILQGLTNALNVVLRRSCADADGKQALEGAVQFALDICRETPTIQSKKKIYIWKECIH